MGGIGGIGGGVVPSIWFGGGIEYIFVVLGCLGRPA